MLLNTGSCNKYRFLPSTLSLLSFLLFISLMLVVGVVFALNSAFAVSCTTWQPVTSMQKPRDSFAGGVIDGQIYAFGGNTVDSIGREKTLERYDPATGNWTLLADNPHIGVDSGVERISAVVFNNKLYVFGARDDLPPTINFNEVYDPGNNSWTSLPPRPLNDGKPFTQGSVAVTYNGAIYLFGGVYEADEVSNPQSYYDVDKYTPGASGSGGSWVKSVTTIPREIGAAAVAVVGSRAYIIGGVSPSPGYAQTENGPYDGSQEIIAYDFQTDEWFTSGLGTLNQAWVWPNNANAGAAVVNGKVYLTGGLITLFPDKWKNIYGIDFVPTNTVRTYDPGTGQFADETFLPYYLSGGHLTLATDQNIYVLGGTDVWDNERSEMFKMGCGSCSQSMPELIFPLESAIVPTNIVTFQWDSTGNSFPLEIQTNSGDPVFTGTVSLSQEKVIPALPDGQYRWRVAASGETCTSDWSKWTTFIVEFNPPDNLVAYYPLNVDVNDYSGNDLHGTSQGDVVPTDGISGGAGAFNGTDAYISLPNGLYTDDNYSYSMWIRPNQLSDTVRTIFIVQGTFAIKYENNTIKLYSDAIVKDVAGILEENVWIHLAFLYNSGSIEVYKNGKLETQVTGISLGSDSHTATIGADNGSYMRGSIDDFRVYNKYLNGTEIQELYDEKVSTSSEFTDKSKAIILAGGGDKPGNWLWEDTKRVTDFAYNALLWQGYNKNNIYYLNPIDDDVDDNGINDDVDADASLAHLEAAITTWATDADNLVLYLADHGGDKTFQVQYGVESETLHASDLASWLDSLQAVMHGRIIIIYEACYSGSFVDVLKTEVLGSNRIVITSSGAMEKSKFQESGRLSFSYQFWAGVYEGAKLAEAFNHGNNMMTEQTAWYDTDSNGLPNTYSDIFPDIVIGPGFISAHDQPIITDKSPTQIIQTGDSASLWAKVNSNNNVTVWAMIVPPEYDPSAPDTSATELPIVQLNYSATNDCYQGTYYGFSESGVYKVSFYAMDDKGSISSPKSSTVEKRDNPPYPWILFIPVLGAAAK